jgi:predicted RNase H-like HicB family nuclease
MKHFTATVQREGNLFVSQCVELDIASQGTSRDEALRNLQEAVELFFEMASASEIQQHLESGVSVLHRILCCVVARGSAESDVLKKEDYK